MKKKLLGFCLMVCLLVLAACDQNQGQGQNQDQAQNQSQDQESQDPDQAQNQGQDPAQNPEEDQEDQDQSQVDGEGETLYIQTLQFKTNRIDQEVDTDEETIPEDKKIKKCEILNPVQKDNYLVYESFFSNLSERITLKMLSPQNIDSNNLKVSLVDNEMAMILFYVGNDNHIYRLLRFAAMKHDDFHKKYPDAESQPNIINIKNGCYLTRELLKIEVGDEEDDIIASEILHSFLENENSLVFDYFSDLSE